MTKSGSVVLILISLCLVLALLSITLLIVFSPEPESLEEPQQFSKVIIVEDPHVIETDNYQDNYEPVQSTTIYPHGRSDNDEEENKEKDNNNNEETNDQENSNDNSNEENNDPPQPTTNYKIAVPVYFYPPEEWDELQDADIIIVNPHNGPGEDIDDNYVEVLETVNGPQQFGYVYTEYGQRSIAEVKADIDKFNEFYSIQDIFVDEASSSWDPYYQELADYIDGNIILNPGTIPDEKYLEIADIIVIFESSYSRYFDYIEPEWVTNYPADRFWHIIHHADNLDDTLAEVNQNHVGYIYITDSTPHNYDSLPSYWDEMI